MASSNKFSFCESVHAGSHSRWHIRRLSDAGRKTGGGIDTSSLCGRLTTKISGWDINVEIRPASLQSACPDCEREYHKLQEAETDDTSTTS